MKFKNLKFKIKNYRGGFTLIETLVAVALFCMATLGPLTLASYSLSKVKFAKDQVVAYYLAEEAMEAIKQRRDNNSYTPATPWYQGMSTCETASGCKVDMYNALGKIMPGNPSISNCVSPCQFIRYNSSGGRYTYSGGGAVDTKFRRVVKITRPYSGRGYESLVKVEIYDGSVLPIPGKLILTIENHLFDWKK